MILSKLIDTLSSRKGEKYFGWALGPLERSVSLTCGAVRP